MIGIVIAILFAVLIVGCCSRRKLNRSGMYEDNAVNNPSLKDVHQSHEYE